MVTRTTTAPSTARWRNAVMAGFALGGITVSAWGPRLGPIRDDLGVGDLGVGITLIGVTVGSLAGLVLAPSVLSRLGARRGAAAMFATVGVGLVVVAAGAAGLHSATVAAIGFVAIGIGIGTVDVLLNVEGAAVEAAARRTLMPLMHAAWSAGVVVGAGIGAGAAALRIPYVVQFGVEAAIVVVAGCAVSLVLRPVQPPEDEDPVPVRMRIRRWLRGWTDPRLLLIGVVMLSVELGEGSAGTWLSLAARDGHGQTEATAALFLVVFAASEMTARIVSGPIVDRLGRVWSIRITIALGIVGVLLFILASAWPLILVGTVLWAVGVSLGFPLGMTAAAESGPRPAERVGVVASVGYLANLGGPPLIGALARPLGLLGAFGAIAVMLAVGLLVSGAMGGGTASLRRAAPNP